MRPLEHNIDSHLRKVDSRWRFLQLVQHSATFASIVLGCVILLAVALTRGWITTPGVAAAWIALLISFSLLGWIILLMAVLGKNLERNRLARALEQAQPKLLDRVNTLVFLERSQSQLDPTPFYPQIAGQASDVLQQPTPAPAFPAARALAHMGFCALLLVLTVLVFDRYSPWQRLMEAHQAKLATPPADPPSDPTPEIQLPASDTHSTEQTKPWGEVRITEPARDLKLTKVDVLPLEIEAAASSALEKTAWSSSLNGGQETIHSLPPPPEPRYAVYKPDVYLDEFQLSDWDLLSYYAWTTTATGERYASGIYFAEIRPFREDLLKLPGGTDGEAYQALSELTALIERQQHILRETHRYVQQPPPDAKLAQQDARKLADAEADLTQAIDHLYARLASEMENKPIGEALDHLATASRHTQQATEHLRNVQADRAQPDEHNALAQLLAARKSFQRSVSENPNSFQDDSGEAPPPVAGMEDQLKSMAEFRNEAKAARDFMQTTVEMQQRLADQTERSPNRDYPKIARSENDLLKSVQEFKEQHPRLFKEQEKQAEQAQQAMQQAADALNKKQPEARQQTRKAAEQLEQLQQQLEKQNTSQQLADAYRLKQMLDRQIEQLGQCKNAPGAFSNSDLRQAAVESRQTVRQLSQIASETPSAFSQPLRDALNQEAQQGINQSLTQLQQALTDEQKVSAAETAQQALKQVSDAFDQSQPQALQAAHQSDPLQPGSAEEQFATGMEQLQRLVQQLQSPTPGRAPNQANQTRLGQEALLNLQNGLSEEKGSDEPTHQVLAELEKALELKDQPIDPVQLQQLLDKLRRFSQELAATTTDPQPTPDLSNIDPALLPPAYRTQIEKYFQKLSER